MRSDLVDLTVQVHARTAKAIRVSDDGDPAKAVWLPLSQIEEGPARDYPKKMGGSGIVEVTLPEWLAKDKGLI